MLHFGAVGEDNVMPETCCICLQEVNPPTRNPNDDTYRVHCLVCGEYEIADDLSRASFSSRPPNSHLLSGAVRETNENGRIPTFTRFDELLSLVRVPKNPIDMMDRVLLSLQKTQEKVGTPRNYTDKDYPLAYAHDQIEFYQIIETLRKMGYLRDYYQANNVGELTYQGWQRVIELGDKRAVGDQAFVAMPFRADLNALYEVGIKPALKETGYSPLRVDKTLHNEKIDDYIISQIQKSRILVADFTGQNAGVYFEAGYAMGLGLHVIRTCRKGEDFKNLHFDTRQYFHIEWEEPQDLKEKLVNRINALTPLK
jgi:hypothetical protein